MIHIFHFHDLIAPSFSFLLRILLTCLSPQHNVLYPCLTVLEHLYFFGNVKGMYGVKLRTSVESVIEEVGLTEKRNALSQALSGGMKRKLSLAIALIGDPKFLLLDGKCFISGICTSISS